jgi:magnesium-transporting ATPase (P-type)
LDPLYLQATSACLVTIVVMQMMNVILCRHPFRSSFSMAFFGNPYILLGLTAELGVILFIVYTDAGNWLFGTAPIGIDVWLLAMAGAALMCLLEELRKAGWRWLLVRRS